MAWKDTKQRPIKKRATKKTHVVKKSKPGKLDLQLVAAASRAKTTTHRLHLALSRRGAVTEHVLAQLVEQFAPIVETPNRITFTGRSATSIVPVVFRRGTLSKSALRSLASSFEEVDAEHWKSFTKEANRPEREAHFRSSEASEAARTNGGDWRRLAPRGVREFIAEFLAQNKEFVDGITRHAATRPKYPHCGKEVPVFEQPDHIKNNLFTYVQMSDFPEGASDTWHCDGGPSMVFMAVSVQGERILQIEDAVGNLGRVHLREGDVYVSTPCSFWHSVKPVGRQPSKTLILRSSVLTRRYSGGRNNSYRQTDVGSTGYTMQTKVAFEGLAHAMSGLLKAVPIRLKFRMN